MMVLCFRKKLIKIRLWYGNRVCVCVCVCVEELQLRCVCAWCMVMFGMQMENVQTAMGGMVIM